MADLFLRKPGGFEDPDLPPLADRQVFKNSCRATVERHAESFDDPLPKVHCHIVHGDEDVTMLGTAGISRIFFGRTRQGANRMIGLLSFPKNLKLSLIHI